MATLSLHSLFELRSCILNGTVMLDMRASTIEEIAGTVYEGGGITYLPSYAVYYGMRGWYYMSGDPMNFM